MGARRRRLPLWPFVVGVLVLVLAWGVWSAMRIASAADHLRRAQNRLEGIDRPLDWALKGDLSILDSAAADVASADDDLSSPLMGPWRMAPFVGRQLRASQAMTASVDRLLATARPVVREVRATVDRGAGVDGLPGLVAGLRSVLPPLASAVREVDLGPRNDLLEPLRKAQDRLAERISDLQGAVATADAATAVLDRVLNGNRRYLVVAGNNAEMGAGMGAFLSAAMVRSESGTLEVGSFVQSGDLVRTNGSLTPPAGLALWARHLGGGDLRTISMTPRFDLVAPYAAELYQQATGTRVDGVVYVDPVLLGRVVAGTGPVEFDGRLLGADELVAFLLHDQYVDPADPTRPVNERRLLETAQITTSLLRRLFSGDFDELAMAKAVQDGVDGRHLMLWSRDADEQAAWVRLGVAGTLRPESLAVTVNNRGANKLDWFTDVEGQVSASRAGDGLAVEVRVSLTNRTPAGQPYYIAGPTRAAPVAGQYVGYVTVHAPAGCEVTGASGGVPIVDGVEDGRAVVAQALRVDPGQRQEMVAYLRCSSPSVTVRLEPAARPRPVPWTIGGVRVTDERSRTVVLGDAPPSPVQVSG